MESLEPSAAFSLTFVPLVKACARGDWKLLYAAGIDFCLCALGSLPMAPVANSPCERTHRTARS